MGGEGVAFSFAKDTSTTISGVSSFHSSNDLKSICLFQILQSTLVVGCLFAHSSYHQIYFFRPPWPLTHILPLHCTIQFYT